MAQIKLRTDYRKRSLMAGLTLAFALPFAGLLSGCAHAQNNESVGMTLLFLNKGPYSIGVLRFDPDGLRGPTPGAIGVGGGKQMSFMPGDSKRGVPQFVEVEWSIETAEIKRLRAKRDQDFTDYSKSWIEETKRINALNSNLIRRIDLTHMLKPELLAQVRSSSGARLKLTVLFQNEEVTITAAPEVRGK